ncbi:binding-protein-dependent transport systems inner membrane component precursor [Bradyrhizobium oligotrophicum S58]|uniref:Binding-protein-dependent transport systems inner membrane component n=1 Tax=Bradyrhizobium oligotrophicum S58 TaxID=1245469 RepID=M4Z1G2_9BRAD|nr:sugar ABC transporter permease [Bradyrhizobium oligotrophicum]BAM86973.1 binding-protein-dependent transport systems inner membrane component precursor [Bradyrhizobium oligotrophicum S58]
MTIALPGRSPAHDAAAIRQRRVQEWRTAALLAAPGFLLLLILFILPAIAVFAMAATDWQLGAQSFNFVGPRNFRVLWNDVDFWHSLLNTLTFVSICVPMTVGLGLAVALLIEAGTSLRALYRAVHFLPFMATMAAAALAWESLLHPTIGLLNQVLRSFGIHGANWLRDESTVLPVLGAIFVWKNIGYAMLLFLAGLKTIPSDLYDAADVDGADGPWSRLSTVTLPLLGPTAMFALVVVALRAFEVFDIIKVLTQGGPGKTSEMLLYTLYVESFEYLRTGYGAAVSVVFLSIVMCLTMLQVFVLDKRVHYQ